MFPEGKCICDGSVERGGRADGERGVLGRVSGINFKSRGENKWINNTRQL